MRITVLAINDYRADPRAVVLTHQLGRAGHDVTVVRLGSEPESPFTVPKNLPAGTGFIPRAIRKFQPEQRRTRLREQALVAAAVQANGEIIHPTTSAAVDLARRVAAETGASVARAPQWDAAAPFDLIDLAPSSPHVAFGGTPVEPGRHAGTRIALAYRKTDSNPGKYLEAALVRAGITVDLHIDSIDLGALPSDTQGVVFVEGPYPAIEVHGETADVPIAFWVHHGEHHLAANLRLAERYRADLILLAHSWHLAHYFRQPVQWFPFGMATDLFDGTAPIAERTFDVAMVGAYIRGGGPYAFRGHLTTSLEAALPSTAFEEGVSAARMAELYDQARIIPNEGGTRHFPITMRVLEAVGAGALLVTQPIPGLDQIMTPGEHYIEMDDDFVPQFQALLADQPGMQRMVDAARQHIETHHLYDHRVNELLDGLARAPKLSRGSAPDSSDELAHLVESDVEVQRLLLAPGTELTVPGREVWSDVLTPSQQSYEAVIFRGDLPSPEVLGAARRYIYACPGSPDSLRQYIAEHQPQSDVSLHGRCVRVDLKAASYRVT